MWNGFIAQINTNTDLFRNVFKLFSFRNPELSTLGKIRACGFIPTIDPGTTRGMNSVKNKSLPFCEALVILFQQLFCVTRGAFPAEFPTS